MAKKYGQYKAELESIISRLESDEIDIDEALELHKQAQVIVVKLEQYLDDKKSSIKPIKLNT